MLIGIPVSFFLLILAMLFYAIHYYFQPASYHPILQEKAAFDFQSVEIYE